MGTVTSKEQTYVYLQIMKVQFFRIFQIIIFIQVLKTSAYPFIEDLFGSGDDSTPDPVNNDPTPSTTVLETTTNKVEPKITTVSTFISTTKTLINTTKPEIQIASILEKYYSWFNSLIGKNLQDYQIILISLICIIRRCSRNSTPEYEGPASSYYGGTSGYGSITIAKQSKRINRRDSGRSMTRGDYDESDAILQTTLDRNKSRKNREMREQIAREFEE